MADDIHKKALSAFRYLRGYLTLLLLAVVESEFEEFVRVECRLDGLNNGIRKTVLPHETDGFKMMRQRLQEAALCGAEFCHYILSFVVHTWACRRRNARDSWGLLDPANSDLLPDQEYRASRAEAYLETLLVFPSEFDLLAHQVQRPNDAVAR